MSDLTTLQQTILADIANASDEAALEAVRVGALGKKGSISALLSTLGKMTPEERKTEGAAINRCTSRFRDHRRDAAAARWPR
jgi:phenylalanyl-tRNA synthetase alpha chain